MNDAWSDGIHFATCWKPVMDSGCENGLYGKLALMQLEVRKVNFPLPGGVSPAGGAVTKNPV